jgi:proteasome lid subunit RPN8/RPN11
VKLILSDQHKRRLEREALDACPFECCGLIEGVRQEMRVIRLHPVQNLASRPDTFEIDPAEQFRLKRALRGSGHTIVGCYHSHPDGLAEPSPRDVLGAAEEDFLWLIAGVNGRNVKVGAFLWQNGAFAPISIAAAG